MRFVRSRPTVCTAALAYLLASALSGLLHNHAHGPACVEHGPSDRMHGHLAGVELDCDHVSHAEHDGSSLPGPASDDDCLACRFVAQSALILLPPPQTAITPLVVELRSSVPTFFIEPVHKSGLARAPPIC
ncbi:MAG TPA: hypothetical protein VNH11_21975 [Pirellulales bacterium]|nr:hypothetical protein [Pirellulales bacterium]